MEQQAETVQEVQEDNGLLSNASAEAETTREEPVGEPESIPHRAEDPTKFFLGLRKTVAWKLISTDIILNHWTDETNWQ